ncbi:MAG: electron transfer flavoprotein subunit beta/FixA family protein [Sedimentisphaerales bacterium]|nr:electron transfer flavoprotein subunit beta/FixA family protein [Sedimentisphaerales bacterium]
MPYNMVVLAKQVPDTKAVTGKAMNDDGTVNRAALPAIFNPEDLNALELALTIKEQYGGKVTIMTMGLPSACEVLRAGLCRGADRAVLITDRRAAASDTLATSYILSCGVKHLGPVDIVVCGRQAIDGDTAQVGPQLAEKLGLPQVTYVDELLEVGDGTITVKRNVTNGWEKVRCRLPAVLTVMDTANEPRPAGVRLTMQYKKARAQSELAKENTNAELAATLKKKGLLIEEWNLDDIKADLTWCGRDGSPTKVHRIQSVVLTATEHKNITPTDEGIREMIHELIEDHTIG